MKAFVADERHLYINHIHENSLLNFWIKSFSKQNIINIKYEDNKYIIYSNKKYKIIDSEDQKDNYVDFKIIELENSYIIYDIEENKLIYIYILDDVDDEYMKVKIEDGISLLSIGGKYYVDSSIYFLDQKNNYSQIIIKIIDNKYMLETKNLKYNIYINNNKYNNEEIKYNDLVFYDGFYFILINKYMYIYYGREKIKPFKNIIEEKIDEEIIDYAKFVKKSDNLVFNNEFAFKRVPKIQRKIENKVFYVDAPGPVELKENMPIIYTMLPMLLMSMTSIVSSANVINNITLGEKTLEESLPSLIIAGCMVLAMILYPIISGLYRKKRESKREIKRIEEYKDYIFEQKRKIQEEMQFQKDVLLNNFYTTEKAKEIVETRNSLLWERKKGTEDFLTFSLGIGDIKPNITIKLPEEHFTIDRDKLRVQLVKLEEDTEKIKEVPIIYDFEKNNIVSLIGKKILVLSYIDNLLIKFFASCSYDDLKIVIFTSEESTYNWEKYKDLPYLWSDDRTVRFFANDEVSYSRVINYLDNEYNERENYYNEHKDEQTNFCNYLLIVDDITKIKNIPIINVIIKNNVSLGFTVLFNVEKMDLLPSECNNFIYIENNSGKLISNVNKQYVEKNFITNVKKYDYTICYLNLSNINLDSYEKKFILPTKYSFLEMYNVNNIKSLDIDARWNNTSTVDSLSVPIGIDENGEIFQLNLHENSHGPHGLIAGMTGSGKSELLISYILSLAVNYNPEEVQFVLIDYKGGGLANTFYNSNIGMILPHVVGVITNISDNEINRSLISLKSEIKRRQKIFAEVSIKYNEGNMDIYKYEALSQNNEDIKCLSHLFIISDEFAELKSQNPEFISELISIARIGRSLGIHLILSTQKPSGVVDDQIWSNSRFRICLKVQDKTDSNDMIKVPNAATIKEPGRFYVQVGYNELFLKAQSAYTAKEYIEKDENNTEPEKIDFLNTYGKIILSESYVDENIGVLKGKEINSIVEEIINVSNQKSYNIHGLWRELIPEKIYYDELIQKYDVPKNKYFKCLYGEYDAPDQQIKGPATLELLKNGNTVIYGVVDSGQELILQTIIYDLICKYVPNEINMYILDFGAETLSTYRNVPQVGDVIFINDKEKIINTFKYINKIIEERKNLLNKNHATFISFNDNNEEKMPLIVIFINILETLFENYENLADTFLQITRECNRYGIVFVITTNGINNIRNKLLQGFKNNIALNLKDKYDYSNLFGIKSKVYPLNVFGRGLIKYQNVYEFQTAYISSKEDNQVAIEKKCKELLEKFKDKVPSIPVLPKIVSQQIINKFLINRSNLPIGIGVDSLAVTNFEFKDKKGVIITGLEMEALLDFYQNLEKLILYFSNNRLFVFNSYNKYKNLNKINNIITDNFGKYLEQLKNYISSSDKSYLNYICFLGIADIYNSLTIDYKKELNVILKQINEEENFVTIFLDTSNYMKKIEFEEFYKNNINNLRGIWIGNGIGEQMIIKVSRIPREFRELVTSKYGFIVDNSVIKKTKLIDFKGGSNE